MKLFFSQTVRAVALAAIAFVTVFGTVQTRAQAKPTIVGIAAGVNAQTGEFSTLIAALQATGLDGALDGKGQFTVFAPTDAAFAKQGLNAGNVASLGAEALTNILLYHVARGERFSGDVVAARQIRMLNGQFARIALVPAPSIAGAELNLDLLDVDASNGVIHVINDVMLPPAGSGK